MQGTWRGVRRGSAGTQAHLAGFWLDLDCRSTKQTAVGLAAQGEWLDDVDVCGVQPDPAGRYGRVEGAVANMSRDGDVPPEATMRAAPKLHGVCMDEKSYSSNPGRGILNSLLGYLKIASEKSFAPDPEIMEITRA
jgi:hypothetical protein